MQRTRMLLLIALAMSAMGGMSAASATTYLATFTTSNYTPTFTPAPAPTDPVIGSFIFSAANLTSPVDAISSINLTIAGHVYSLSEIEAGDNSIRYFFGGLTGGPSGVVNGANDFAILFNKGETNPRPFLYYSVAGASTTWLSGAGSMTISAIPEPSILLLFLSGFAAIRSIAKSKS